MDRYFFLVEEAPLAFDGRPLCFVTGTELEEVELVAREGSFFSVVQVRSSVFWFLKLP